MSDRFKTLLLKSVDVPVPAEACVDGTVYDGVGMTWHDRFKYRSKCNSIIIWWEANVNDALVATSSTTFPVPIEWILPYEFQHGTHPARCAFHRGQGHLWSCHFSTETLGGDAEAPRLQLSVVKIRVSTAGNIFQMGEFCICENMTLADVYGLEVEETCSRIYIMESIQIAKWFWRRCHCGW